LTSAQFRTWPDTVTSNRRHGISNRKRLTSSSLRSIKSTGLPDARNDGHDDEAKTGQASGESRHEVSGGSAPRGDGAEFDGRVIQEAKKMASQIQQSSDLWDLEHYLTQRRKEIDRKYDYRYSQLTQVFGRLLYEKRLREEELRGLREDKLKPIRSFAKFLAEDAA
jgi:hypothetical protein